jgi:hypothetical protein
VVEFSADGILFDARDLVVPAQGSADVTLTDLPYDVRVLQAHLSVDDALELDNTAWTVTAAPSSARVALVSDGNFFLERALNALPGIELVRLAPAQPLPAEPYDLYVYDGAITGTLPSGSLWLVGPTPSAEAASVGGDLPIRVGGLFTATAITRVADDPLLRYVALGAVHVLQARAVVPPPGARVLVESAGGPLLFVAEGVGGQRVAVLTFDLHDSDLPLQIAFPVLVSNLTDWLLPQATVGLPELVRPGDPVPIRPGQEATEVRITAPDGGEHAIPIGEKPPVFAATDQLGVYLVEQVDRSGAGLRSAALTVNLFDAAESNIAPRELVRVGQEEVSAAAEEEKGRREFWPWLAGAALGLLVVEWVVYQRGTI